MGCSEVGGTGWFISLWVSNMALMYMCLDTVLTTKQSSVVLYPGARCGYLEHGGTVI